MSRSPHDAHRHIGVLPAYPLLRRPADHPDTTATATVARVLRRPSTPRASSARWCCPTTACPTPTSPSGSTTSPSRPRRRTTACAAGCGSARRPSDAERNDEALALAGEDGVARPQDQLPARRRARRPRLRRAARPDLHHRRRARPRRARAHLARRGLRHRPDRHPRRDVRRRHQDPPRPPRRRDERPHEAHRRPALRLDRGRQAGLHRHQLGDRLRPGLAGRRRSSGAASATTASSSPPTRPGATSPASTPGCAAAAGDGALADAFFHQNFDALYGLRSAPPDPTTHQHPPEETPHVRVRRRDPGRDGEVQGGDPAPLQAKGTNLYGSTKLFPDYQASEGQAWLTLVHGIPHESLGQLRRRPADDPRAAQGLRRRRSTSTAPARWPAPTPAASRPPATSPSPATRT